MTAIFLGTVVVSGARVSSSRRTFDTVMTALAKSMSRSPKTAASSGGPFFRFKRSVEVKAVVGNQLAYDCSFTVWNLLGNFDKDCV